MVGMLEPTLLDAEIARARAKVRECRWRVMQDCAAYGLAHVSKINQARWVSATRYLTYLLSTPVSA